MRQAIEKEEYLYLQCEYAMAVQKLCALVGFEPDFRNYHFVLADYLRRAA